MDLSKFRNGFVKIFKWICLNCRLYLSKLHGKAKGIAGGKNGGVEWGSAWCCSDLLPSLSLCTACSVPALLSDQTRAGIFLTILGQLCRGKRRHSFFCVLFQICAVSMKMVLPFTVVQNVKFVQKSNEQFQYGLMNLQEQQYLLKWPTTCQCI